MRFPFSPLLTSTGMEGYEGATPRRSGSDQRPEFRLCPRRHWLLGNLVYRPKLWARHAWRIPMPAIRVWRQSCVTQSSSRQRACRFSRVWARIRNRQSCHPRLYVGEQPTDGTIWPHPDSTWPWEPSQPHASVNSRTAHAGHRLNLRTAQEPIAHRFGLDVHGTILPNSSLFPDACMYSARQSLTK